MSQYPDPQPGRDPQFPQTSGGDPLNQPGMGMPSGGYPSGELAPYDQPAHLGGWQAPQQPAAEQSLTTIGDITVTQSEVITPAGRFPIRGSVWTVTDMTQVHESIPGYAVVLAIVFFLFCLLGLLFLLMKERKMMGHVQVTVQGNGVFHSTMIPAHSSAIVAQVNQQVNYARSLAAMA